MINLLSTAENSGQRILQTTYSANETQRRLLKNNFNNRLTRPTPYQSLAD
ncbi:hypothetical protein [Pseudomonas sp. PH1b]|nr:hypothetical protein [Pseudomonas sp. PH1b]